MNTTIPWYRHLLPPLLWTLVVGLLCGIPGNNFPTVSFWKLLQFDSAAHAFVFAVFSFLWAVAFAKKGPGTMLRRRARIFALLLGIGYGILIEILQYLIFARRSAEWTDMVADTIGAILGVVIIRLVYGKILSGDRRMSASLS